MKISSIKQNPSNPRLIKDAKFLKLVQSIKEFPAMMGIYKITSPSKKIYIGQSNDIITRWKSYKKLSCKSQRYLYHSLKKYGVDKHKFEIICKCLPEQLNELEKYYVDLFQTFNSKYGLNLRDGGGSKGRLSEETKNKISQTRISLHIRYDDEYKKRMSDKLSGKNNPMYGMSGELSPNWGKNHTVKTLEKMRENHKNVKGINNPKYGIPQSKEATIKASITKKNRLRERKGFYIFNFNDKQFECLTFIDIAKVFNVNPSSVRRQYIKNCCFREIKILKVLPSNDSTNITSNIFTMV